MAVLAAQAVVRLGRGDWPQEWVVNPQVRSHAGWLDRPQTSSAPATVPME